MRELEKTGAGSWGPRDARLACRAASETWVWEVYWEGIGRLSSSDGMRLGRGRRAVRKHGACGVAVGAYCATGACASHVEKNNDVRNSLFEVWWWCCWWRCWLT